MKRDLDQPLLDLDGEDFEPPLTLGTVCYQATAGNTPFDSALQMDEKLKLYALAKKVHKGGEVELTAEDIALLKKRVAAGFGTMVTGRACEMLEQDNGAI